MGAVPSVPHSGPRHQPEAGPPGLLVVAHNWRMRSREPAILAIDLGTSEVKAGLVGLDGRMLGDTRAGYPMDVDPGTGCAEQDPDMWWAALGRASRALAPADRSDVIAVCCVGQGPTLVPVDAGGRATYPAVTWMDSRPGAEAEALEAATGLSGWSLGILPAARWLERTRSDAANAARWYLNAWEWAGLRLAGVARTTRAFGQVLPDRTRAAAVGLHVERLPDVVPASSRIGGLTTDAAEHLGLSAGTPVVAGTVDSFASFHGAGLLDAGNAVDTGGTSGGLAVYWDSPIDVPGAWVAPAPLPDRWIVGGAMTATGKALDWLDANALGGGPGVATLLDEASRVPAGADGLVFLPYLAGERSPIWDPSARGAFVGLTLAHGRAHLARAVLEAAAFALRHVAQPIRAAGVRIDELRVTGGTARGDVWNQIKADVLGLPVAVPAVRETAVLGAAILGAVGVGQSTDARDAIERMVRIDHRLAADPHVAPTYDALFGIYVDLWPALAPSMHALQERSAPGREEVARPG